MRGEDRQQMGMFSYISMESRVPADHPLRAIRKLTDTALDAIQGLLGSMYSHTGRPSVPPEKLIRALLLQVLYSIRSERQLMEQLDYNLLYRWFVGLNLDDAVWDHSTFSKNRERLIEVDVARALLLACVEQARGQGLVSDEHFSVDGTLLEAWASQKSFRRKDEPPGGQGGDFRNEPRSNDTHASRSDPEARLYRKARGQEARLAYLGHILIENRHALVVDTVATQANGTAEREAALQMVGRLEGEHWVTVAADKGYDAASFIQGCIERRAYPHVAMNTTHRRSAMPAEISVTEGYTMSQHARKRVEQPFGWGKRVGRLKKLMLRGLPKVGWFFTFNMIAYNLLRLRTLSTA